MPSRTKQPARATRARVASPARRVSQAPARPTRQAAVRQAAVRPARQATPTPTSRTTPRHTSPNLEGRAIARRATVRPATPAAVRRTVARTVARPVRETAERSVRRPPPQPARRANEAAQAPEALPPTCVHEWVIEPPNGPTSQGKCRRCDEVRAFRNSLDITYWDTQRHGAGAAQRRKPATPPAMPARRA